MPAPDIIRQLVARFTTNRDIASTDRQIDALVYDLYSLTPAEVKIIKGK